MSRKQQLHRPGPQPGPPGDDTGCTVLHVDMDAFFVSVELLEHPELRGRPVVVGGAGPRGVVAAASYEARAFGVHSAMPMSRARRLCPQAVVLPPRHARYAAVSAGVMEIFRSITPLVEPLALDEAFLDVAGALRRLGRPAEIGRMIREQVYERQGITCSVGVASTKFVAKLASTRCKPDGLLVVPADGVVDFLHPLPVAALWGVGERTEETLRRLGLRTVGDLARTPVDTLRREVGEAAGRHLHDLAWGRDPRSVTASVPDKSIGAEETFDHDIADPEAIRRELLRLSDRVGARLRGSDQAGRTVAVKLRRPDFTTLTRARTLPEPTDVAREVYATACALYEASGLEGVPLRLVGVRVENLVPAATTPRQLTLDEPEVGWRQAEAAMDLAARRFGAGAVRPAALVRPDGGRDARHGRETGDDQ
ncbi:DNA polymerase IV [Actinoallomurus rhizosphaericola]|uniref:DNA polymerase IV n=1 Tax=Actinoallomurus rhizosphaericola TaxID=2952536 RepID=UPI002093BD3E|nr:DNA polymerase IV [Actinoallomurus rhizosphaericola]MCO5996638.1 DNA polymerase IV [Actinoallomurus rhizosphaericola]